MSAVAQISGLTKSYGGLKILDGIDLELLPGSTTAIVGSSGCGKTTLLRLIAGFDRPDSGSVLISGQQVSGTAAFVPAHRRTVGYVAQDGGLFPHLTVGQNIAYGLPARHRAAARRRVGELLETVALEPSYASRRPHELSGGQQQRVALARALARQPKLMLLDEPFSALDAGLRASTRKAVAGLLASAGVTTLVVTHDQEEAMSIADRVAV
ncbi:MAG: ABC transporter ATP-binding protein, partial [Mycobacterium sp.]|nr:ABC transporter ATP-binding protein [Mycobacterium sp.]